MSDYVVEKRLPDGSYERFNMSLRSKIYQAKTKQFGDIRPESIKHPIIGKDFSLNGQVVTIIKVIKDWQAGFFYTGIYVDINRSHGLVYIENINSVAPEILSAVESFKENFKPF